MRSRLIRSAAFALSISALAVSHALADSIVAVGAGKAGSWDTEVELANPTGSAFVVQVGAEPFYQDACPMQCRFTQITLAPYSSTKLNAADIYHSTLDGLFSLYVIPQDGISLPVVRARVSDAAAPLQAVELPAVRLSSVAGADTLMFPSVRRTATGHSNLLLTNLDESGPLTINLDLYSADGQRLGGTQLTINPSVVAFLGDVALQLGVDQLETGQVLVTKVSSTGSPWGEVATVDSVSGVFISVGRNP